MQNRIQWMIHCLGAAFALILIHVQRQAGDGFRNHPHAGVDRAHLNGGARRDRFARCAGAKIERGCGADRIRRAGLVPGAEQTSKWIFHDIVILSAPKMAWKKALQLNAKTPVSIGNDMMDQGVFRALVLIVCHVTAGFPESETQVFRVCPKQRPCLPAGSDGRSARTAPA